MIGRKEYAEGARGRSNNMIQCDFRPFLKMEMTYVMAVWKIHTFTSYSESTVIDIMVIILVMWYKWLLSHISQKKVMDWYALISSCLYISPHFNFPDTLIAFSKDVLYFESMPLHTVHTPHMAHANDTPCPPPPLCRTHTFAIVIQNAHCTS